MTTHGGKRENAGRKPVGTEPMPTRAFVITQDQDSWIAAQAQDQGVSKSEIVRSLIQQHRAEHTLKPKR